MTVSSQPGPCDAVKLAAVIGSNKSDDAKIGGMTTVIRGSFQYCGGNDDHWTVPLPSKETGGGQTVITFPHIKDVGVFPLLITRLDATSGVSDWLNWGQRVIDGAQKTADTAATIGTRKMVVMGDMQKF